jgi:metallo-beta-lactamase class B
MMKKLILLFLLIFLVNFIYSQQNVKQIWICSELQLIKLSENAYIHISYLNAGNYKVPSNGLILIDHGKAFLFDTPTNDSTTKILLGYIKDSLKVQVVGFICNDWHIDSMGGLDVINKLGIPSYSNEMTIQTAKSKGLPVPVIGFKDSTALKLGNSDILCYYLGAAHTIDNIVIWIPSEQILFADCMVKEMKSKDLGFTGDGDLKVYPLTLSKVKFKFPKAKIVIPGHGEYGGIELIEHTLEMAQAK